MHELSLFLLVMLLSLLLLQGPPDGGHTGFAQGWRTVDGGEFCDVSTLPWGPLLLPHLMQS